MISTLPKTVHKLVAVALFGLLLFPLAAQAQSGSLTLSVSPTLFDMTANPEQEWESVVRVINSNPYEISLYADVVNFAPQGESGQPKFLPLNKEESGGQTLAEWITLDKTEFTIAAEQIAEVPFRIKVPAGAPPGGHFGAILIGTKSLDTGSGKTAVETSQVVTSLIFLRVTGDIVEDGEIREFRTTKYISEKPTIDFELRFQNKGTVHILPQGEIKILNMWGEERGIIPVNRQTMFGNVLPNSIRKYTFSWSGEWSLADIGRYRAVATLAYGNESRQFASSEVAFWVLPWKIATVILVTIIGFIMLMTWAIKLYIRKMLTIAGVSPGTPYLVPQENLKRRAQKKVSVVAPFEEGILDLRQRFTESVGWGEKISTMVGFVVKYRIFFAVSIALIVFITVAILYARTASVEERAYEVVIDNSDTNITISSEQVQYETLKNAMPATENISAVKEFPKIKIINQSGVSGLAAELRVKLESSGYEVAELSNEMTKSEANTVIVYAPEYDSEALELSRQVYGALLSAYDGASGTETPIIIYVGEDLQNAVQ